MKKMNSAAKKSLKRLQKNIQSTLPSSLSAGQIDILNNAIRTEKPEIILRVLDRLGNPHQLSRLKFEMESLVSKFGAKLSGEERLYLRKVWKKFQSSLYGVLLPIEMRILEEAVLTQDPDVILVTLEALGDIPELYVFKRWVQSVASPRT